MSTGYWESHFDKNAGEKDDHKKVGMTNPYSPLAKYVVAEDRMLGTVLDIGCGTGKLAERNPYSTIFGADISVKLLAIAKQHGPVVRSNISHLPFRDNSFDTVISLGVIQNCGVDPVVMIREMFRIATTRAIVTGLSEVHDPSSPNVPNDPNTILSCMSGFAGIAVAEWGAIKYDKDDVWLEDWNLPGNGTFYICVDISSDDHPYPGKWSAD